MVYYATLSSWRSLEKIAREIGHLSMAQAFRDYPSREATLSAQTGGLLLDYSRQRVDSRVIDAWCEFFDQIDLASQAEALFAGD